MNKNFKTKGIIIRKVDFGEADRIVTVLTEDFGKIDCIAKGARRLKSKFSGRLELFSHVLLTCFQGKTLACLNEAELLGSLTETKELDRHRVRFYMAELTHKLIQPEQELTGAYHLLEEALAALEGTLKYETVLQTYLIKLLTLSGFLPPWNHCSSCNESLKIESPIYSSVQDNHVLCPMCASASDPLLKSPLVKWVYFMQKYPLSEVIRVQVLEEDQRFVWGWLQRLLDPLLSSPLRSEAFFRTRHSS